MLLSLFPIIGCAVKISLLQNRFIQKWHHLQTLPPISLEVLTVYYIRIEKHLRGNNSKIF